MLSSKWFSLALLLALVTLSSGCCTVPVGCGGGCAVSSCHNACPGLFHGELAARVHSAITGGCCSGCGEIYYDEQINEPPTCDPCCGNGEFTGDRCGPCRPLFQRLRDLWCSPCPVGSSCDSCGTDVYATDGDGSGYCPNCRDGVAGNPESHVHPSHLSVPSSPSRIHHATTSEGEKASGKSTPTPALEPIPDPMSDAPTKDSPVKVQRSSANQLKSAKILHVPAHQAKQMRSTVQTR